MGRTFARKAEAADVATTTGENPLRATQPGPALPRGNLDPLILALSRAVDRQAPAPFSGPRENRTD